MTIRDCFEQTLDRMRAAEMARRETLLVQLLRAQRQLGRTADRVASLDRRSRALAAKQRNQRGY